MWLTEPFHTDVQLKGQRSGASRWLAGVKVDLLADTSVGGPKAALLKRPVNHRHLFTMRRSPLAPGIQLAISLQPLYPQPRPDKGLFTWQSASGRPRQRKERGSFQLPVGSKSSAHKRLWSHGSNLKLKGEMRTLDSLAQDHIKCLAPAWSQIKVKLPWPWRPRSLLLIFKALEIMSFELRLCFQPVTT